MNGVRNLSNHIIRLFFFALILVIAASIIYAIKMLAVPLIASVLLSFLMQPLVNFFEARNFNRLLVIVAIYIIVTLIVVAGAFFIVPRLLFEAREFAKDLPSYELTIQSGLVNLREVVLNRFPSAKIPDLYQAIRGKLFQNSSYFMKSLPAMASSFFSLISLLVLIPIITFFFLTDGHIIQKAVLRLIPNRYFEMFVLLFHKVALSVQSFIRGQLIDALAVGIMTSVGLGIIGIPYNIVIGIVAGLGNLIPYLGPVIGFLPAFFVLVVSPEGFTALGLIKIVIVFVLVQFLEGTFIYPIAVGKSVNLHPLIVIVGITVGGQLGGLIGMLIAIPIISVVKVTVEVLHFYLKRYSII